MKSDPKSLATYLEIVDQRRRYQRHMRFLQEAQPMIDTSPIPMNPIIAEKQQETARNRVLKFQLEEDKLKFVNDLYELNKKKKKSIQPKKKKRSTELQSSRVPPSSFTTSQGASGSLESSTLSGISPRSSQRKYPKLVEPKSSKKTSKISMSVQANDPDTNYNKKSAKNSEDHKWSDVDIPFEYSGYMEKGNFYIAVDEKDTFCVEDSFK